MILSLFGRIVGGNIMENNKGHFQKKRAHEDLIEQLLLCDPVTERGREKLYALDLHKIVTPDIFFSKENHFWVSPQNLSLLPPDNEILYDSTPDERRIKTIVDRRQEFEDRFSPEKRRPRDREGKSREFTLLMGVVGAGKSMELQRQIYLHYNAIPYSFISSSVQQKHGDTMCENVVYVDMERVNTVIPKGDNWYTCPDTEDALALFLAKLLATTIYYIEFLYAHHRDNLKNIGAILNNYFKRQTRGNETSSIKKYKQFIDTLHNYANDNAYIDDVFDRIIATISEQIEKSKHPITGLTPNPNLTGINVVLQLLGFVMFGIAPKKNKCIVVDNVEDLIKVDDIDLINISLEDAKKIYKALLKFSEDISDIYDDAGIEGSFHIVMALRRTTWDNLQVRFAGNNKALLNDMFDITGDVSLTELWKNKAYRIWTEYLETKYDDEASEYIEAVNRFLCTDINTRNGVAQRYARIMSHGLRRQGHSLSKTLFNMFYNTRFGVFSKNNKYIGMSDYKTIFSDEHQQCNAEAKYLCKSATVEYYLIDQFTSTGVESDEVIGGRWRSLNIGHIKRITSEQKEEYFYGFNGERRQEGAKRFFTRCVYQIDNSPKRYLNTSGALLRKLLSVLFNAPEALRASKCAAPLYETVSLYQVIKQIFGKDDGERIDDKELLKLAKVILAGASPDVEAEYSPLYLLQNGVDFKAFYSYKNTLKEVWKALPINSEDGDHTYSRQKCGIRITESGCDFLHNIQPSFEFFSAMFCYDFPPLLFIKSIDEIAHVIGCVYDNANKLCGSLEVPERLSFRRDVQRLHKQYLTHYRDYVQNMGDIVGLDNKSELVESVNKVIEKYAAWM